MGVGEQGVVNISEMRACFISRKYEIGPGSALDIGRLALLDEVNPVKRVALQEYIIAFAYFKGFELRRYSRYKVRELVLEELKRA